MSGDLAASPSPWQASNDVSRLYGAAYDFAPHSGPPTRRYVIAAAARTGSTYLALRLLETRRLGAPLEYLNLDRLASRSGLRTDEEVMSYWRELKSRRTSPNGVLGLKIFPHFALRMRQSLPLLFADVFDGALIVRLRRRDEAAQAVSMVRAQQTQRWFSDERERSSPRYDFSALRQEVSRIRAQNAWWDWLAESLAVEPLQLEYEDVWRAPGAAVQAVAQRLGVDLGEDRIVSLPQLAIQRDALSAEWTRRLRRDLAEAERGGAARR